jgi:hypothetical protein
MTAPLHYAISKQLKELGWINDGTKQDL